MLLRSQIPLPEMPEIPASPASSSDVRIMLAKLPPALPNSQWKQAGLEIADDKALLTVPSIARYLIESGQSISVEPDADADAADVRLFLLGTAFGILCHQRGVFPLHASAVVVEQQAIAFIGPSGAGKSTLGAWLSQAGHPLLNDDVCILTSMDNGQPMIHPGSPRIKLWSDALSALGIPSQGLQRDMTRTDKFHLTLPSTPSASTYPLRALYLIDSNDSDKTDIHGPIKALDALAAIADNTYRHELIDALRRTQTHFHNCSKIARHVPVFRLQRPRSLSTMDATVNCLQQHWQSPIETTSAPRSPTN